MNDLQRKELELAKIFLNICNQENLTYFFVCGSALGAIKYHGFIPWDDDIDIALPRSDYEKFLSVASKYLPDWCFLQNYRTDPMFPLLGTKLRDSRTTFVEKMCGRININHGVFIDIFPLDCHWQSHSSVFKFKCLHREFEGKRRVFLDYRRLSRGTIYWLQTNTYYLLHRWCGLFNDTASAIKKYELFLMNNMNQDGYWCNYANSPSRREYSLKRQYGTGVLVDFEGMKIVVPEKYDEYLSQKYGNWRADLPEEQKKGHHYYEILDLEHPYTDYIEEISRDGKRITKRRN